MLQIFFGVALVVQLTGCFYHDDDRWHHDHDRHDSGVDVHVHG
jgi:hypothetical protein